jgi:hypothetical protein
MAPEKQPRFELTPKEIAVAGGIAVAGVLLSASIHTMNYLKKLRQPDTSANGH